MRKVLLSLTSVIILTGTSLVWAKKSEHPVNQTCAYKVHGSSEFGIIVELSNNNQRISVYCSDGSLMGLYNISCDVKSLDIVASPLYNKDNIGWSGSNGKLFRYSATQQVVTVQKVLCRAPARPNT